MNNRDSLSLVHGPATVTCLIAAEMKASFDVPICDDLISVKIGGSRHVG
jgi:hypothetical protein